MYPSEWRALPPPWCVNTLLLWHSHLSCIVVGFRVTWTKLIEKQCQFCPANWVSPNGSVSLFFYLFYVMLVTCSPEYKYTVAKFKYDGEINFYRIQHLSRSPIVCPIQKLETYVISLYLSFESFKFSFMKFVVFLNFQK